MELPGRSEGPPPSTQHSHLDQTKASETYFQGPQVHLMSTQLFPAPGGPGLDRGGSVSPVHGGWDGPELSRAGRGVRSQTDFLSPKKGITCLPRTHLIRRMDPFVPGA